MAATAWASTNMGGSWESIRIPDSSLLRVRQLTCLLIVFVRLSATVPWQCMWMSSQVFIGTSTTALARISLCHSRNFSGGELWNEKRGGTLCAEGDPELMGELINVAAGPAFLPDPTAFHETRSWTGRRIILIAYSVLGCEQLAVASRPVVEALGFSVAPLGLGPFAVFG